MLTSASYSFRRFAAIQEIVKVSAENIDGKEWFCKSRDGRGIVMSTSQNGTAPTPSDYLMMALGSCASSGVKFLLQKSGKKVNSMLVDVEGEWEMEPKRRIKSLKLNYTLEGDLDEASFNKALEQQEKSMCPVSQTLKRTPTIKYVE